MIISALVKPFLKVLFWPMYVHLLPSSTSSYVTLMFFFPRLFRLPTHVSPTIGFLFVISIFSWPYVDFIIELLSFISFPFFISPPFFIQSQSLSFATFLLLSTLPDLLFHLPLLVSFHYPSFCHSAPHPAPIYLLYIHIYMYISIYRCVSICIYIYIHICIHISNRVQAGSIVWGFRICVRLATLASRPLLWSIPELSSRRARLLIGTRRLVGSVPGERYFF